MDIRCTFALLFLYATAVVATKDNYHQNEDPDRMIMWTGLFTQIDTLMAEMEKVNQNFVEVKNRQFDLMEKPYPQWTTILRRQDGSVNFYRNWTEYQNGFGNPPSGEFFIGLDRLHEMTTNGPHELMVVLRDWENEERSAHYDLFEIGGEDDQYALNKLGAYSGDAGDSLQYYKGIKFTTFDRDNDMWAGGNCAMDGTGAWWFKSCSFSHLTGPYRNEHQRNRIGVKWYHWKLNFLSLKYAEMKIRPKTI